MTAKLRQRADGSAEGNGIWISQNRCGGLSTDKCYRNQLWHGKCSVKLHPIESRCSMLSQCANSQCSKPFLRLREGKLFLVETDRQSKPGESVTPPFVRARQQPR